MSGVGFIVEPERRIPLMEDRDVIVAGGGVTGVMAAVAAAREGSDVLLVERNASLGGVAAMGLPIQGYVNHDGQQIVKGLAEELRQRLVAKGGALDHFIPCEMHNPYLVVDPEMVKLVLSEMLRDAGVKVLLHTQVANVRMDGDRIDTVFVEGKSGREAFRAKVFIDCTGDADLAALSGAPFSIADAVSLQASTLNFILTNVDTEAVKKFVLECPEEYGLFPLLDGEQFFRSDRYIMVGLQGLAERARREDPQSALWGNVCYITLVAPGTVCVNSVHVDGYNACDTRDLSEIERLARERVHQTYGFYKKYVPGFENAALTATAPWAGIRETRILEGRRTLTLEAIRRGEIPPDSIALGGYPVDVHSPENNGLIFFKVPTYGIPYGCMLPQGVQNLLVAGRTISASREAMASSRVMAQCMAEGEAAGTAAALCAREGLTPEALPVERLRSALIARGAKVS